MQLPLLSTNSPSPIKSSIPNSTFLHSNLPIIVPGPTVARVAFVQHGLLDIVNGGEPNSAVNFPPNVIDGRILQSHRLQNSTRPLGNIGKRNMASAAMESPAPGTTVIEIFMILQLPYTSTNILNSLSNQLLSQTGREMQRINGTISGTITSDEWGPYEDGFGNSFNDMLSLNCMANSRTATPPRKKTPGTNRQF